MRREEDATDDGRNGNPVKSDQRTDTDAEKARSWKEDIHIGAECSITPSLELDLN